MFLSLEKKKSYLNQYNQKLYNRDKNLSLEIEAYSCLI